MTKPRTRNGPKEGASNGPSKKKKLPKTCPVKVEPVEMISYSIKMVIPTVQFGNIQPEIVVKAKSPKEAHDYIAPHMNKLWKEYYLVDGKRPEPVKKESQPVTPNTTSEPPAQSPVSSVALVKATQAINSCMSKEALDLIVERVKLSVKLTDEDKESLLPVLEAKDNELSGKK